ncbi:MAG: HAMP domain-containing sensor histidine kinase [Candidatus Liptonbacteria bacterium]
MVLHDSLLRGAAYRGIPLGAFTALLGVFIGLYVLSRRGHIAISSVLLVVILFLGSLYGQYQWGPDLPGSLLSYALIIVIASILLGTRAGFIMAMLSVAALGVIGYLKYLGIISERLYWKSIPFDAGDGVEYAALFFLIMAVSWLANREIEKSLFRARSSEAKLKDQRDVLEIKVEERTRELRAAESEQVNQLYRFAKFGKLASGYFHDLMSPLAAMSLHVQKIQTANVPGMDRMQTDLNNVVGAAKQMEDFIVAIRKQLSREESLEMFSLAHSTREVVEILQYKACHAHTILRADIVEEIESWGNPIKFSQIVLNLISNAIDACDAENNSHANHVVHTSLVKDGNSAVLKVKDNGCGIPRELSGKIFEPFFTTKTHRGIGIGLSMVKDLVEKDFKGTISVSSEAEKGSCLVVELPIKRGPN